MVGDDLAHPVKYVHGEDVILGGFTKRELIAAMAMQGLLKNLNTTAGFDAIANFSVRAADALIERLAADSAEGVENGK